MVFKKRFKTTETDELGKLASLAQSGDKKAYSKLLKECIPYIRSVLNGSLADSDSIEDVTQEVLISVHKALNTYSPDKKFKPWLYSIIQFRKTDYLRKYYSKKENVTTGLENVEFIENYVTDNPHKGEYKDIENALGGLPEKQKDVFVMMKVEGYTAQEVANKTGMSVSAVKVSVHRTMKKLQEEIG
ncbi:MAG: RNA polymerase sigma factor [Bdellovibrionales bacterium]